jgi:3-oxoacyl-[acyl-carrier protein] reductase
MDLGLRDRVYIVTGATDGLGKAAVASLIGEGARVVASSRSQANVDALCREHGDQVTGVAADNADPATPDRLIAGAQEAYGRLDGLLISVGGPPRGAASIADDAQWLESFNSIFLGSVRLAREVAEQLPAGGAIGMVLSSSVRAPIPGLAISNAFRPALAMFAKTLADEVGPKGIRVLGLVPGRIDTERTRSLDAGDPEARARSEALIPLRRLGAPEEFGRVAAFMLSPAASYVSGSIVSIDGGLIRGL